MADETKAKHDPRPQRPDNEGVPAAVESIKPPPAAARRPPKPLMERNFEVAEFKQVHWFAIADSSVQPEDLLTREYWALVAIKAKPGNKITIWREDRRMYAEMVVVAAGPNWVEPRFLFPPLMFDRDEHAENFGSDFEIRDLGEIKHWSVIRRKDGNEIHNGSLSPELAHRWLAEYVRSTMNVKAA